MKIFLVVLVTLAAILAAPVYAGYGVGKGAKPVQIQNGYKNGCHDEVGVADSDADFDFVDTADDVAKPETKKVTKAEAKASANVTINLPPSAPSKPHKSGAKRSKGKSGGSKKVVNDNRKYYYTTNNYPPATAAVVPPASGAILTQPVAPAERDSKMTSVFGNIDPIAALIALGIGLIGLGILGALGVAIVAIITASNRNIARDQYAHEKESQELGKKALDNQNEASEEGALVIKTASVSGRSVSVKTTIDRRPQAPQVVQAQPVQYFSPVQYGQSAGTGQAGQVVIPAPPPQGGGQPGANIGVINPDVIASAAGLEALRQNYQINLPG